MGVSFERRLRSSNYSISCCCCDIQHLVFSICSQVLLFWLSLRVRSRAIFRQVGVVSNIHRFIVGGSKSNNGYTTKFVPQSISSNSDFSSALWSMTALSAGTDDIVSQSGVTIDASAAGAYTDGTNVNQTVTYNLISSVTSDAYIQIATQSLFVSESTTNKQIPNLSCSISGSASIVYSLSNYNSAIIPSFVSINSTTGVLTIAAPSVSSSTSYSFYIDSTVSGMSGPVQKIINLTIKKCTVSNCQICTVTDSSVCATCNSGFSLSTGSWNLPETAKSEVAKLLSTANQVIVGAIALISVGSSWTNLSSMASLRSVINQMQILFLLFLTGAFIPQDIEDIITGLSICLNPFSFLQLKSNWDHNFVSSYFDFGLKNSNLEKFGIKSDSTIVNLASFLLSIIIILILHLWIFLVQKLLPKESKSNCWNYVLSGIHWILQKLMILFTFALYIRVILQTNQFILISWVSEIYQFNFYGTKRIISIIIALFVFIAWIAIIAITIILTWSNDAYKLYESPDERSKFEQLFSEVSLNKKSRIFVWLLQIRRAVFVILLITIGPEFSIIAISILVGLQLIYFILLVVIRPYKEVNCNAIEIINELYFLVILASLLKYNNAADWEGTPTTAYTWFISSNSFISLLVNFGKQLSTILY